MTKAEVDAAWRWKCPHGHRGLDHWNCYIKAHEERVAYLDLECSGLQADFGFIICWCIKPKNRKRIVYDIITMDDLDSDVLDSRVAQSCAKELARYDRVITHYGTYFDIPFLRTRCLTHGIPFLEYGTLKHSDVWAMAKAKLKIHSNRQNSVAQALRGFSEKTPINPTHWLNALRHDEKGDAARRFILDHCKRDVRELQRNHEALEPYCRKSNKSI